MEYIILWILALFGLWCLISKVVESAYIDTFKDDIEVIIKAKNHQNISEYLVKEIEKISMVGKVTVVDMDANDETMDIVHRLDRNSSMVQEGGK